MRKIFIYIIPILLLSACFSKSDKETSETLNKTQEVYYTCSMHPQIKMEEPGKCPICGMGLTKIIADKEDNLDQTSEKPKEEHDIYYCESDPSVTSLAPGECPLDGTKMLKKDNTSNIVGKIRLRKSQINHFRADLYEVGQMKMHKDIRLLGTLLKAENKESNIPARVPGRVEEVFVESTGSLIRKGDPVLKLYSSELLTGGDEYLIAAKNYKRNKKNKEFKELYEQSIQRLKLWGVKSSQLEAWEADNKIPREITIYSPVTGIVLKKNAIKGKYFQEGQSFFDLVDLNTLWVELDVYEHDSAHVKLGQSVNIEFSAYPGEIWEGKLDFINPVLDKQTRTLKVRTTLSNESGKLRPGMVGTASLTLNLTGMPLVIPRTAIIDTGKRKVVWIEVAKNKYQAQKVHTGFESQGYVEVKAGLKAGDKVVIDGNFLIDAQAQLFGGYEEVNSNEHNGHNH